MTDEWKKHDGEKDPPCGDKRVEVRFADGDTAIGNTYDWDQNWQWAGHEEHPGNIVAYRVLGEAVYEKK